MQDRLLGPLEVDGYDRRRVALGGRQVAMSVAVTVTTAAAYTPS